MTVIESGTAVNVKFIEEDVRATAIHEAGHAASAHVYRPEVESSRLSIRMRGRTGGHHQSFEKEERFGKFQSMMFGELIHAVGAMAAELAFYGENSNGVGGDMAQSTWLASLMVGGSGMSPLPIDLHGKTFDDENEEQSRQRVLRRFEDIGYRMMNRTAAGWDAGNDPRKRAYVAQFLGQALVIAYNLMLANREKVQAVAEAVMEKQEIFGDDLVRLLDSQNFVKPEIDWTSEESWPKLMNWSGDPREMRLVGDNGNADGNAPRMQMQ
jgi:Peptidase family M41